MAVARHPQPAAFYVSQSKPLVGISADRRLLGDHYFHCVGEKYIAAVVIGAGAIPVLIPALGAMTDFEGLMERLDGVLLTGSPSNVEPHHYEGDASVPGTLHDANRDATVLPLIPRLVNAGMPLLAICRGFQEMNVAFGGTLWQRLHEIEGLSDHREDPQAPLDEQYGPAHEVTLEPGGLLQKISGSTSLQVNSLHWQGVRELAPGLEIEARADDGVIEAFRVAQGSLFAVGVQWHPEWKITENVFSQALFASFGDAAREYSKRRKP
jgi:putative glutamine amidotransferase